MHENGRAVPASGVEKKRALNTTRVSTVGQAAQRARVRFWVASGWPTQKENTHWVDPGSRHICHKEAALRFQRTTTHEGQPVSATLSMSCATRDSASPVTVPGIFALISFTSAA